MVNSLSYRRGERSNVRIVQIHWNIWKSNVCVQREYKYNRTYSDTDITNVWEKENKLSTSLPGRMKVLTTIGLKLSHQSFRILEFYVEQLINSVKKMARTHTEEYFAILPSLHSSFPLLTDTIASRHQMWQQLIKCPIRIKTWRMYTFIRTGSITYDRTIQRVLKRCKNISKLIMLRNLLYAT